MLAVRLVGAPERPEGHSVQPGRHVYQPAELTRGRAAPWTRSRPPAAYGRLVGELDRHLYDYLLRIAERSQACSY
jgi:hypothetical protein